MRVPPSPAPAPGRRHPPAPEHPPTLEAAPLRAATTGLRPHALASAALLAIYVACMSGHLASVDGLLMERQAHALVFDHSVRFRRPVWNWNGEAVWNSNYGIGLSLLYVPAMMFASPLAPLAPVADRAPADDETPATRARFYWRELYEDPLYTIGVAWVHAVVAALTAFLVARLATAVGCSRAATLWGMAFFGLGSSSFAYARGDFAQPLEGLCWMAALVAAMRLRRDQAASSAWLGAAAVAYAVLTRPLEGLLLVPAALALVLPWTRGLGWSLRTLMPAVGVVAGGALAAAATLLVNAARFGNPLQFGYSTRVGWTLPDAWRIAAVVVSPGRGLLWEFPALVLVPLGAMALWRRGRRVEVATFASLCAAIFVSTLCWHVWWGGWCWGLRLFVPATPLMAVTAAAAVDGLEPRQRRWVPAACLLGGLLWVLPCIVTDIQGGFAERADGANRVWNLSALPLSGAWRFVKHAFAETAIDRGSVDILWFRLARDTGYWSLGIPLLLLVAAAVLFALARREMLAEQGREDAAPANL